MNKDKLEKGFSVDAFLMEDDASLRTEQVTCSNCKGKITNVVRRLCRTMPKVLVVVVSRAQFDGGAGFCSKKYEMPRRLGNHELKAVIRHVNGGTHFVHCAAVCVTGQP